MVSIRPLWFSVLVSLLLCALPAFVLAQTEGAQSGVPEIAVTENAVAKSTVEESTAEESTAAKSLAVVVPDTEVVDVVAASVAATKTVAAADAQMPIMAVVEPSLQASVALNDKPARSPGVTTANKTSSIASSAIVASAQAVSSQASVAESVSDTPADQAAMAAATGEAQNVAAVSVQSAEPIAPEGNTLEALPLGAKVILDNVVLPNSYVRLTWNSDAAVGGFSEATPVLVVNGAMPGNTLCMVGAVHGDELNGIEMIRQVIFDIDPSKLTGTIIGVPVANIMGFRRNSRYLPDRRDWNRYFPGNTYGSSASRLAHSFFTRVISHCDSLVDLHTGSFHRTNFPQLRADLADESVASLAQNFGDIAVLNGRGNANSLRAAAVRAGIPAVTMEAGEPMTMQRDIVIAGVRAIKTMLAKTGMYGKPPTRWNRIAPVYYRSMWVRANQSGILFSSTTLGKRVKEGELLGTVTDPVTNARTRILSPFDGRVLGMALDQVVLPGFAAYHIGIQTPESILIEESQQAEQGAGELDDEDGDDAGIAPAEGVREQPSNQ